MARLSWPNRITMTRIFLIGPFVLCLLNLHDLPWTRHAAVGIFLIMAVSDGVDGWLARRLHNCTRLGAYLDAIADKILVPCAMIMLGYEGTCVLGKKIPDVVVVAAVGKDLVVVLGFVVVFLLTSQPLTKARLMGKTCTTMQLITVPVVLLWPDLPSWLGRLPDVCWWVATCLALIAAVDYVRAGVNFVSSQPEPGGQ